MFLLFVVIVILGLIIWGWLSDDSSDSNTSNTSNSEYKVNDLTVVDVKERRREIQGIPSIDSDKYSPNEMKLIRKGMLFINQADELIMTDTNFGKSHRRTIMCTQEIDEERLRDKEYKDGKIHDLYSLLEDFMINTTGNEQVLEYLLCNGIGLGYTINLQKIKHPNFSQYKHLINDIFISLEPNTTALKINGRVKEYCYYYWTIIVNANRSTEDYVTFFINSNSLPTAIENMKIIVGQAIKEFATNENYTERLILPDNEFGIADQIYFYFPSLDYDYYRPMMGWNIKESGEAYEKNGKYVIEVERATALKDGSDYTPIADTYIGAYPYKGQRGLYDSVVARYQLR